jgi:hypothetical protein
MSWPRIVDEDVEALSDRLKAREAELEAQARGLKEREKDRNELCWCKSGKKYKNCHLPR